ncbi:galactoside alpha-(1,2)-fucosyltransferase 2-like [Ylistrum balloti]|uniref:galactoside alpha-(1,2)-fucosyltransferase 2-like n=1 Tax=Ylistrum balloti TaxID=509963 RepID=UPI002905F5AB|nr:galactoside alpha-(1,2)-fucosyltransferase 2-like [Ylistrum balloti]
MPGTLNILRSGRPLVTTPHQDRFIRLSHIRNRHLTATETANNTLGSHNRHIHPDTVRNRLRVNGLRAQRPYVGQPLTPSRRQRRLAWLQAHSPRNFPMRQWRRVFFTDESLFTLYLSDGRLRVYRRRGERYTDACVAERDRFGDFILPAFVCSLVLNVVCLIENFWNFSENHHGSNYLQPQAYSYLCPFFRGGLGNLMFMYASIYGMAKEKGMGIGVYKNMELYRMFNITEKAIKDTRICDKAVEIYEYRPCAYDVATTGFTSSKNIRHKSYLQSWRYFEDIEEDIRAQFVFKDFIKAKAADILRRAVATYIKQYPSLQSSVGNLTIVGVHIRRGDYLKKDKIQYGYEVASSAYVEKALQYFRDKYNNTLFLIFTNPNPPDIKWCKQYINGSDVVHMKANAREIDMCAISQCNHTVMTVGTFGWWASWINKGETIYYKDVATPKSSLLDDFSQDMTDYFYPGWIGMD